MIGHQLARPWIQHIFPEIAEEEPVRWNLFTIGALVGLVCIWATLFFWTWGRWGDVTVDCGREMYVPWELTQGKTLYRDIWYLYGPIGPYLNSVLFRLWGVKLEVLYWAGSLSALSSAVLLYLTGMRLKCWYAGWTAGAVLLAEAFSPNLFCFPLPYSFAAVYGCVAACFCFWCCVNGVGSPKWVWVFAAASAAAVALLIKIEFGAGCYAAAALLVTIRALQSRTLRRLAGDLLAFLPGLLACTATVVWMISLRGPEFLLKENLMGLPGTWFYQRYGKLWFSVRAGSLNARVLISSITALLIYLLFRVIFHRYGLGWRVFLAGLPVLLLIFYLAYYNTNARCFAQSLLLPRMIVLLNLICAFLVAMTAWRRKFVPDPAGWLVLMAGSSAVAARTMFNIRLSENSIYFNGPVILAFLLLVSLVALPKMPEIEWRLRPAEVLPFALIIAVAFAPAIQTIRFSRSSMEPLRTERGLIYVSTGKASPYEAAIRFMITAAQRGESTLSVPEDMSLYFLAGVHCATRVFAFTPGLIAPGKMMNEVIADIENSHTRWLIWSNRSFPEYGTPTFGVDFDQPLGDYFRSHFRPVASLPGSLWSATIWERANPAKSRL